MWASISTSVAGPQSALRISSINAARPSGSWAGSPGLLIAAFLVSAAVGLASLKLLLVALSKGAFPWFAAYCGALATFTLGYLALN